MVFLPCFGFWGFFFSVAGSWVVNSCGPPKRLGKEGQKDAFFCLQLELPAYSGASLLTVDSFSFFF